MFTMQQAHYWSHNKCSDDDSEVALHLQRFIFLTTIDVCFNSQVLLYVSNIGMLPVAKIQQTWDYFCWVRLYLIKLLAQQQMQQCQFTALPQTTQIGQGRKKVMERKEGARRRKRWQKRGQGQDDVEGKRKGIPPQYLTHCNLSPSMIREL